MKTLRLNKYLGPLSFYKDALKIAVPVMAQALIQTMVSLIDNTTAGPVLMYTSIKLVDFVKIAIAAIWLKKGKWIKNLAVENRQDISDAN